MFSLGFGEILIICVILIVVVGPERLPGLMKGVGKTMRTVREASRDLRGAIGIDELMREDVMRPMPPRKPPAATVSRNEPPKDASAPAANASDAPAANASVPAAPAAASTSAPVAPAAAPAAASPSAPAAEPGASASARVVPPSTVVPGAVRSPFPKIAGQGPAAGAAGARPAPRPASAAPPPISAPPPAGPAHGAPSADAPQPPPAGDASSERKP